MSMTDDLACPNCGGTEMKIVVIDSFGEDRVHIMAFCALGGSCKVYPVLSTRAKATAVTIQ